MPHWSFIKESRENWGVILPEKPLNFEDISVEEISLGALCRIASSMENIDKSLALLAEAIHPDLKAERLQRLEDLKAERLQRLEYKKRSDETERERIIHYNIIVGKLAKWGLYANCAMKNRISKTLSYPSAGIMGYNEWNPDIYDWSQARLTAPQRKMITDHIQGKRAFTIGKLT